MNLLSLALAVRQVCSSSQWLTLSCWKKSTSSFKMSQILKMPQTTEQQPPAPPPQITTQRSKWIISNQSSLYHSFVLCSPEQYCLVIFFSLKICWVFFWVFPFLKAPWISSPIKKGCRALIWRLWNSFLYLTETV